MTPAQFPFLMDISITRVLYYTHGMGSGRHGRVSTVVFQPHFPRAHLGCCEGGFAPGGRPVAGASPRRYVERFEVDEPQGVHYPACGRPVPRNLRFRPEAHGDSSAWRKEG